MKEPLVRIHLDGNGRVYQPGETLSGRYWVEGVAPGQIKAVEVSVLWHTEGKGDEDLAVHHFCRLSADNGQGLDPRRPGQFRTVLPQSPLSYHGLIIQIRWCVRVRAFLAKGREVVGEVPFRLGEVLPPRSATFWARASGAQSPEGPQPSSAAQTCQTDPQDRSLPGDNRQDAAAAPVPGGGESQTPSAEAAV
ncbi:MAG: hypothetical protein ACUVUC_16140 [Thermoguttaceae bacterium]